MARAAAALSDRSIKAAITAGKVEWLWDSRVTGFGVRIYPDQTGPDGKPMRSASYVFQYRVGTGRSAIKRRLTIGKVGSVSLERARQIAQRRAGEVAAGLDPFLEQRKATAAAVAAKVEAKAAARNTIAALAERFLAEHVKPQHRQAAEYERILRRYVLPSWGQRRIDAITRADVHSLIGDIRTKGIGAASPGGKNKKGRGGKRRPANDGRVMAHNVLAVVRRMFTWHQTRSDTFVSPVVPGMSPISRPLDIARDRVLTDDELRRVWRASDKTPAPYGPLIRYLFLTSVRRDEAAGMQWAELDEAGAVWTVPPERMKHKRPHVVPLSQAARDLLASLPRHTDEDGNPSPFVFTVRGAVPFNGFSKAKAKLDKDSGVTGWRLHDLRRTSRGLMSRGGIPSDIAERVLAHVIPGVRGTYDRYAYFAEKAHALAVLAQQIDAVLSPPPPKVVRLADRAG